LWAFAIDIEVKTFFKIQLKKKKFFKLSGNSLLLLYLCFQKYIFSYFRVYFLKIFLYSYRGKIHAYHIKKSML
jgi:hypothetical protein